VEAINKIVEKERESIAKAATLLADKIVRIGSSMSLEPEDTRRLDAWKQ